MRSRLRLVITAAMLCHLLACVPLVTSQTPPSSTAAFRDRQLSATEGEPVTIRADQQEKAGDVYTLRGNAEVEFRNYVFRADEVQYDSAAGRIIATGHVTLDGGEHDEHLTASRGEYSIRTDSGRFYDVTATTGVRFRGKSMTLTTSSPFTFTGRMVEKVGRDRFVLHHGTVTSCELPEPKWTFNAERVTVELGGTARIYDSTFRVRGVPVLFLPYAQHPVDKLGRQSGFLVPTFGASSRKGTILGESFYWAMGRSADATIGAEYYSSRGWAQHGDFRARPSPTSFIEGTYFGVLDRGFGPTRIDQGGEDIKLNAEAQLPLGFRGVISANYLSSFVFRLAFTETFSQAVNSEVRSLAFASKSYRGIFFNVMAARYQNFQSTQRGDVITIAHAPALESSSVEQRAFKTPVFWSYDVSVAGLSRSEPGLVTDPLVLRADVNPRLSLPMFLRGWTFRPEVALRNTYYSERKLANGLGTPADDAVNRRAFETSFELRPPTVGRIFEQPVFGQTLKHTLEAGLVYRYVNGVENFANIIRFDQRDILSDTNEIEYGFTQRLFAKKGDDPSREVLSWELKQKYFFEEDFGGAILSGHRNMLTTTALFSGIAFLTEPRHFSPIVSRLRGRAGANADVDWEIDYDSTKGRIQSSNVLVNYRTGNWFVGGSHVYLRSPGEVLFNNPTPAPDRFSQFRVLTGYGGTGKRGVSAALNLGVDANLGFLQYSAVQSAYNWDCCGVSMEYRRFALGAVRNENQFRFAFTLANIGTFGNMKRQERIF